MSVLYYRTQQVTGIRKKDGLLKKIKTRTLARSNSLDELISKLKKLNKKEEKEEE